MNMIYDVQQPNSGEGEGEERRAHKRGGGRTRRGPGGRGGEYAVLSENVNNDNKDGRTDRRYRRSVFSVVVDLLIQYHSIEYGKDGRRGRYRLR